MTRRTEPRAEAIEAIADVLYANLSAQNCGPDADFVDVAERLLEMLEEKFGLDVASL